jgi:hypothetical protein
VTWVFNHAVAGQMVGPDMEAQRLAAVNDAAHRIVIELGMNNDNAGNMATLQSRYETEVAALKISNPNAEIFCMGVPPAWTDNTGAVELDKENIRTAEKAACVAQGITYVDMYDDPVYAADATTDGKHPTLEVGHPAIEARMLAAM